jgi:hypothetical protein
MMLRFRGGGVGHKSTRAATDCFKKDRDRLDIINNDSESEELNESDADDSEMLSDDEILDEDHDEEEEESSVDEEEEDFGIKGLKEQAVNSDSESDPDEMPLVLEEPDEEDFGPEGDGMGPGPDMDELGYGEM